ncbi:precorrin-2 dehydrogenase/sirohydrochlorin ferrochelatase family protein [Shouchella patagoniensis]|uniref:precorrin-2 dehydrogenase/sirohydrochlorin ferrochelatase family protein n=1 Tax=Shouchella patagoniensis TaxID=228576 RepID=UPI0009953421|nr:bifunctional precorrin-2 dehydrogenase/sirohydrochlorin ferrochelatase [Shouchella patagoniensis]
MSALPFMVNVEKMSIVVVGGGSVALKRTKALVLAGGFVHVIAPTILPEFFLLKCKGLISVEKRAVGFNECFTSELVFLCSNNKALHDQIYKQKAPRQHVYLSNKAQKGDFYVPAKIEKGLLTVSVSTAGASPSYTKRLKNQIDEMLPEYAAEELIFLQQARRRILHIPVNKLKKLALLKELASPTILQKENRQEWFEKRCEELERE